MTVSSDLRRIQQQGLLLLRQFSDFCAEHGIRYFICGGTLLGAARDGRFIPWDDDFDISMLREDYMVFLKIAERELPPGPEQEKDVAEAVQFLNSIVKGL